MDSQERTAEEELKEQMLMTPKWGSHQDHAISKGSFSRNQKKKNGKMKDKVKQGIQRFCFDQLWCSSPERCHCRGRNTASFSLSHRGWDAPSLLLLFSTSPTI